MYLITLHHWLGGCMHGNYHLQDGSPNATPGANRMLAAGSPGQPASPATADTLQTALTFTNAGHSPKTINHF